MGDDDVENDFGNKSIGNFGNNYDNAYMQNILEDYSNDHNSLNNTSR